MPLYELSKDTLRGLERATFAELLVRERDDIQRLLRDAIEAISPDTMVVAEEFGDWEDSGRRIDLLGIDREANLVVIELKRTESGGHMELQALRYAAMVATMTFDRLVDIYRDYLVRLGRPGEDAEKDLLAFLGWQSADEGSFAEDVRIVLASADFSKELTTAVMWLNERDLDIRCVRLQPYRFHEQVVLDIQQIIPLPEAGDYQVRLREKQAERRQSRRAEGGPDRTRYDLTLAGQPHINLPKRTMLWLVVQAAIQRGIRPEDLPLEARSWLVVEGACKTQEEFEARVAAQSSERTYDRRRWFSEDGKLFSLGGRTYSLSSQWGSTVPELVEEFARRFPQLGIKFERSTKLGES